MAQLTGSNLPPPQEPFVDAKTLNLSYSGYQYLLSLLTTAAAAQATASVATGLTATGTNQATALQLNAQWNEFDTVGIGTGALLSAYDVGQSQTIFNQGVQGLNIYPPPGSEIDALGVNQPYILNPAARLTLYFTSATQIRS